MKYSAKHAFIFHVVTDIPRARQFYEGLLGLKTGMQIEFGPGQWWIEYDIAGQALELSNAMPGKPAFALALEVADLDTAGSRSGWRTASPPPQRCAVS